jgi:hypothetical protein
MDRKNAFHLAFRIIMATKLRYHFPHLLNYFKTFYFNSSSLFLGDPKTQAMFEFFSCEGVQQSDPLAPFLFCLASLDYIKKLQEIVQSGISPAFFDDINIVASTANCLAAISYAKKHGPDFGLYPQPHKFSVLLGVCGSFEEAVARKKSYQEVLELDDDLADKCIKIHPDNAPDDISRQSFDKRYGMRVLGAPIGSEAFIQDWLQVAYLKICKEADTLQASITTLQVQWSLIYYCLRNKVNHLFRVLPPRLTSTFCSNLDSLFKKVLERNIQSDLPPVAWIQAKLSFEEGGNGLGDMFSVSHAAFLASSISCFETVKQIVRNNDITISDSNTSSWISDIWSTTARFNSLKEGETFNIDDLVLLRGPQMQRTPSALLDAKLGNDFHKAYSNSSSRARKLSVLKEEANL